MRRFHASLLLCTLLAVVVALPACAPDRPPVESDDTTVDETIVRDVRAGLESGAVEVTVIDAADDAPLDYAQVTLEPVGVGPALSKLTLGGEPVRFDQVPAGSYHVRVAYLGFRSQEAKVEVTTGPIVLEAKLDRESPKTFDAFTVRGGVELTQLPDAEVDEAREGADLATVRAEEITDYAVKRVEEAVVRQTGAAEKVYARGGRSGEVGFRVDGVAVDDPVLLERLQDAARNATPGLPPVTALGAREDDPRLLASRSTDEIWILVRGEPHVPAGPPIATPGGRAFPRCGTIIVPRPDGGEIEIPLESTDVRARIDGYVSSVDVRQRFQNPFDETIEAEYVFPLPHDAAVNDFVMVVGERRIRGIIREREEARRIYERALTQGFKAALLEQERPNVFRQKVANIEANETIDVEMHFFGKLPYLDGAFEFAFPLVVGPRYNPADASNPIVPVSYAGPRPTNEGGVQTVHLRPDQSTRHRVSITVDVDAGLDIESLGSPSHVVHVDRDGRRRAHVELSANDRLPNKDFVLKIAVAGDAVKSSALVHRTDDGEGYFSLMLVPPADLTALDRAPVEFVFVVDCSGSMNGWPLDQAKRAMRRALRQLGPDDTFQIIRFSERASALGAAPIPGTPENVTRGLDYVDALRGGGGTQMIEGIKASLDFPHAEGRMRIVSFMTDGYIGNEDEIFAAVADRIEGSRIFSFGVGTSVNRHLLEGLARIGRGAVAWVGTGDDDTAVVDAFFARVRHPAMTDVTIDWGGMQVTSVYPTRVPDLFVGRPILLHGAFAGDGRTTVTVRGRAGRRDIGFEVPVDLEAPIERPALPLLWARTRIQDLSDRLAIDPTPDLKDEGLQLALGHNLMSPWTSFVAVDGSRQVDDPADTTVNVPTPMPQGVDHETTVGRNR